jgi:hypothetical protein
MQPRSALTTLLLVLLLGIVPAVAEPVTFQEMRFEQPESWQRNPNSRPTVWQIQRNFPGDERGRGKGAAMMQISSPIPVAQGSFERVFAALAASIPELAKERPMTHGEGQTVNGHRIAYDRRCCGSRNGVTIATETVGVTDGRNSYILMLVTMNLRGDNSRAASNDFEALVRSFRPGPTDRAFELVPPAGAGGRAGVYTHLDTGIRPNAFGGTDFYADNELMVFDRSGLYSDTIPQGEEDIAAHCRRKPTDCGIYRVEGGRIRLQEVRTGLGVLRAEEKPLVREGQDLKIDGELHRRVPPFPAGARLQGVWRYFFASSGSGAFSSGSVAVERILTLTSDGRFRRTGFSGASSTNDTGGGTVGFTAGRERPIESGRYTLDGYRLVLTGDDGREERLSVFRPDIDSDGVLVINGSNYIKRDGKD